MRHNKSKGEDWVKLAAVDKAGTKWEGTCSVMHEFAEYTFRLTFEIPVSYPVSPVPLAIPELDGKTEKMYRGGKICLDAHFQPLWTKNAPKFGIAHALSYGLAPWLAAEIPSLIKRGVVARK